MEISASIRDFFNQGKAVHDSEHNLLKENSSSRNSQNYKHTKPGELEPGLDFLDSMSTGTARFIIDREVSKDILEKFEIKELENKGHYYIAKIVNQKGDAADTVLIDKLNRSIHLQKAKFK